MRYFVSVEKIPLSTILPLAAAATENSTTAFLESVQLQLAVGGAFVALVITLTSPFVKNFYLSNQVKRIENLEELIKRAEPPQQVLLQARRKISIENIAALTSFGVLRLLGYTAAISIAIIGGSIIFIQFLSPIWSLIAFYLWIAFVLFFSIWRMAKYRGKILYEAYKEQEKDRVLDLFKQVQKDLDSPKPPHPICLRKNRQTILRVQELSEKTSNSDSSTSGSTRKFDYYEIQNHFADLRKNTSS